MKSLDHAREDVLSPGSPVFRRSGGIVPNSVSVTTTSERLHSGGRARSKLERPKKDAAICFKHDARLQFRCEFAAAKNNQCMHTKFSCASIDNIEPTGTK
jgi:hypothetical protein